jgi:hypothetical protein
MHGKSNLHWQIEIYLMTFRNQIGHGFIGPLLYTEIYYVPDDKESAH